MGLIYRRGIDLINSLISQVYGYTDADFANDIDTRKSTSGFIFMLAGAAISWRLKQQDIMAKSSYKAEYVAVDAIAFKAIWLRLLLLELRHP